MIRSRKTGLSAVPQMYHEELDKRTKARRGAKPPPGQYGCLLPGDSRCFFRRVK